jgi:muconolactone D-isomerase
LVSKAFIGFFDHDVQEIDATSTSSGTSRFIYEESLIDLQKRLNPGERKEKPMEYLTDMVTMVPEGTSPAKVDELRAAEAVRAAELAKAGHLVRLWRPPLGPGEWRSIGLFRAADEAELHEVLASLPLHIWMKVTITPLTPHPNDPEYRAREAMDHPQA